MRLWCQRGLVSLVKGVPDHEEDEFDAKEVDEGNEERGLGQVVGWGMHVHAGSCVSSVVNRGDGNDEHSLEEKRGTPSMVTASPLMEPSVECGGEVERVTRASLGNRGGGTGMAEVGKNY